MPLANVTTPYLTIAEVAASLRVQDDRLPARPDPCPGRNSRRKILPNY